MFDCDLLVEICKLVLLELLCERCNFLGKLELCEPLKAGCVDDPVPPMPKLRPSFLNQSVLCKLNSPNTDRNALLCLSSSTRSVLFPSFIF
jgi:hypothetical protein